MNTKRVTAAKAVLLSVMVMGALSGCDNAAKNSVPAYVDLSNVLSGTDIGKQEQAHLEAVKEALATSAKQAGEAYKTMPEADRKKAAAVDAAVLNRTWVAEEQKARMASVQAMLKGIEAYRAEHHLSAVLNRTSVLAADAKGDISGEVIKSLAGTKVTYGQIPALNVRTPQDGVPAGKTAAPEKK